MKVLDQTNQRDCSTEEYVNLEFQKAADFYDNRAVLSKKYYILLSVYVVVISAILTVVTSVNRGGEWWGLLTPVGTASIGVSTSVLALFKFQANWLSYRATWDALQREKRLYNARVGRYKLEKDPTKLFATTIEEIRSKEGEEFYSRYNSREE